MNKIQLVVSDPLQNELANQLVGFAPEHILCVNDINQLSDQEISLLLDERGLALCAAGFNSLYIKDIYAKLKVRQANLAGELLIQAVKLKNIKAVDKPIILFDLTAGLAKDAVLLAGYADEVVIVESNPIIALILYYAKLTNLLPGNITLIHTDSFKFLANYTGTLPHIIYLDPMFEDTKTAKSKKDMQFIQMLYRQHSISQDHNNSDLLALALQYAQHKVVVKRDNNGQAIPSPLKPAYTKQGKSTRYDIYQV